MDEDDARLEGIASERERREARARVTLASRSMGLPSAFAKARYRASLAKITTAWPGSGAGRDAVPRACTRRRGRDATASRPGQLARRDLRHDAPRPEPRLPAERPHRGVHARQPCGVRGERRALEGGARVVARPHPCAESAPADLGPLAAARGDGERDVGVHDGHRPRPRHREPTAGAPRPSPRSSRGPAVSAHGRRRGRRPRERAEREDERERPEHRAQRTRVRPEAEAERPTSCGRWTPSIQTMRCRASCARGGAAASSKSVERRDVREVGRSGPCGPGRGAARTGRPDEERHAERGQVARAHRRGRARSRPATLRGSGRRRARGSARRPRAPRRRRRPRGGATAGRRARRRA